MSNLHIPSQRFAAGARNAAPVAFHAAPNKFPFHYVGAALVLIGVCLFGVWAFHAASAAVAPLNAALAR